MRRASNPSNWYRLLSDPLGNWRRVFRLSAGSAPSRRLSAPGGQATSTVPPGDNVIATLDVVSGLPSFRVIVQRDVLASQARLDDWTEFNLPFELAETTFGVEFRVNTTGFAPLVAERPVRIEGPP
jgi:hypothetical protein